MFRRANHIPRTLIGVNGVRLYDIPGVIYPAKMLRKTFKYDDKLMEHVPDWGIPTREAAKIVNLKESAARDLLHGKGIRFCRVENPFGVRALYWDRDQVQKLADERAPYVTSKPERLMTSEEAMACLKVASRHTLRTYVKVGLLHEVHLRIPSNKGPRLCCFYPRAQVYRLARARQSMPYVKGLVMLLIPEKSRQIKNAQLP